MDEPMKAAVFICRAHGVNLLAMRSVLKDPCVGHSEVLPRCCAQEGLDQIQLHLRGMTTNALVVIGCLNGKTEQYEDMAMAAGVPPHRVAVVPVEMCRTTDAAELALAKVLDTREPVLPAEPRSSSILLVGEGRSAAAAMEEHGPEGVSVLRISVKELLEPGTRILGGPGDHIIESGEALYEFGRAALVIDREIDVRRDRICELPGTVIAVTGGADCLEQLLIEVEMAYGKGDVYVVMQETPFTGTHELEYREMQSRGMIFLRSAQFEALPEGIRVLDEHLGEELILPVGELITISSSRPEGTDQVLRMFGLPAGWSSSDMGTGDSGVPGVHLGGSALTALTGESAERAARSMMTWLMRTPPRDRTPLARVDKERCSLCLTCLRSCPYHAPHVGADGMSISVSMCRGCGICLSMCPSRAIDIPFADLRSQSKGETNGHGGSSS